MVVDAAGPDCEGGVGDEADADEDDDDEDGGGGGSGRDDKEEDEDDDDADEEEGEEDAVIASCLVRSCTALSKSAFCVVW